ncbi:hypothetical protein NKI61_19790 [Mesorhizobium sp. M0514]|uniref:hypothetical protein n=1 Tax=Mesorhizobium sp. M0514 TaxID=2956955 RepID=UPI0033366197
MKAASIPFTQFLRPNGRLVSVSIERPAEVATKAQAIIAAGYRFECEELTTGDVSLTVANDDDGDLEIEVVPNGPTVPAAVDRLVERAFKAVL